MPDSYKQALRLTQRYFRKSLPPSYQHLASRKVCAKLRQLQQYRYAKRIALYRATEGEIDLNDVWKSAPLQGKYCYLPALNDDYTLSFLPATPASILHKNRYNIEEPDVPRKHQIKPDELDLILLPVVAFDNQGTRLGMGAGYYDRTLTHHPRPLLIGVAYEFQRVSFMETQAWDVPMDLIVTEYTIHRYHRR